MKNVITAAAALAAMSTSAWAGGVERTTQSVGIIFEKGNLAELSLGYVTPKVSGVGAGSAPSRATPTPGASSGNMTENFFRLGFAYKQDFNESLSFALIYDQPFGADVSYPTGTGYFAAEATAELNSHALTGVLKYTTDNNISVFGGLRYQTLEAQANVPFVGSYTGTSDTDGSFGYLVGAAYERPDIALRVALTYNSAINHDWSIVETGGVTPGTSSTSVETPQSINLEFQSGIAKDTLIFGSVRWVDWSEFAITPNNYFATTLAGTSGAQGSSLVAYNDDRITYTLGLGHRFNETWSGAISVTHEPSVGGFASNLGPTDGQTGVTLAATYKKDKMEITGGVSYIWIGDAQTRSQPLLPIAASDFTDNSAIGVGVRIRYRF